MPQMAPIWWTTIMTMTLMMFALMTMINYFNMMKKTNKTMNLKKIKLNWKW